MAFSRRKLPTVGMANTTPDWARSTQYAIVSPYGTGVGYAIVYQCKADGYLFISAQGTGDNDFQIIAGVNHDALVGDNSYGSARFILSGGIISGDNNQSASLVPVRGATHPWYIRVRSNEANLTRSRFYFVPFVSTPTQTYLQTIEVPTTSKPMGNEMSGHPANVPV
ncbi:MAG: hypothetical protein WCS56_04000 [Bacilli bacterium]